MTVTQIKECGEWMDFFQKDSMVTHARIEIFTVTEQAQPIVQTIMQEAHTGGVGDAIVAILPVQQLYRVRTRSPGVPSEL